MFRFGYSHAIATAALVLVSAASHAHHAFSAEYDAKQILTLKGVVSKVEWTNPHIYVFLDVTGEGGKVVTWELEGLPPRALTRLGWTRTMVQPGESISVRAFASRSADNRANLKELTMPDGRQLAVGAAE